MAGGELFRARARLRAPAGADIADIQAALEDIATELMVEGALER
jgi:glycine cleavage system regulatory protein